MAKRRKFSEEFKRGAVVLANEPGASDPEPDPPQPTARRAGSASADTAALGRVKILT